MTSLKKIFISLFICTLSVQLFTACNKEVTIPKKEMANILVDMYLADFYIERHDMHSSTDSLLVYDGVLAEYGYTYEQYEASVRKYIIKDDEYIRIHKLAQEIISKRKILAIKRAYEMGNVNSGPFWLSDSVRKYSSRELLDKAQYRSYRWLAKVKPNDIIVPGLGVIADTSLADFPSDVKWWQRNVNPNLNN